MVRKPKLLSSIRAKLFSAVAMLLVAVIMVVSSTYAWFTLSTAPEVTGMTTAIGANGSLEMALLPSDGLTSSIDSSVGNGVLATVDRNITWGNLVDLSDSSYGLDKITLYPSTLNLTDDGKINTQASILQVPAYGADGRITEFVTNTSTGVYVEGNFAQSDNYGVRGVGSASGMTTAQLYYRDGRSAANTAMSMAKTQASTSLKQNGSILADIALAHATDSNSTHSIEQVEALKAIVDDLLEDGGILAQIDKGYEQYVLAYVASQGDLSEEELKVFKSALEAPRVDDPDTAGTREDSLVVFLTSKDVPEAVLTALNTSYGAFMATKAKVEEANGDLTDLLTQLKTEQEAAEEGEVVTATWNEISDALYSLADIDNMKINGYAASSVRDNMNAIIQSVMNGGLTVTMATGGGVYADVADHCGDYRAEIVISEVTYNNLTLENTKATMVTDSTVDPSYLSLLSTAVEAVGAPAKPNGEDSTQPLTEMYGYIVDMAFRTNAASSNLLLQTAATDRIYSDNATDSETYGHGSYMAFQSASASFTNNQVAGLMEAIRIVFFDPTNGTIFAYARLNPNDLAEGSLKIDADGYVSAEIVLYKVVKDEETGTVTEEAYGEDESPVITALNQNQAHAISVLVYLEGNNIENSDVATDAATSMKGKMNLQFSSSATLVPMENGNLHTPGANAGETPSDTPAQGDETPAEDQG